MSSSHALNDEEVFNEMNKMVTFIRQEAIEKAREIRVKADEEFNIEKAKLVRQESINIEASFQRKIKQAEVQKKISQSNHVNKSRLKVLQARQQLLEEVFLETRNQLQKASQDKDRYSILLKDLILQGLYQLMDENVSVTVRKCDLDLVENAIKISSDSYKESTKLPINIEINKEHYLPDDSAGGIILSSCFGRIKINNTLEERLNLAQDEMLPELRALPDSDALWFIKASRDLLSYNDMFSLQHKVTETLIGRESLNEIIYHDYTDSDFADHVEVYCSTPSRTSQFNYHWMAQRINYTKYDSSYVRSGDIINIRNVKDNSFLRSHEYQITIYNENFQEVISQDKKPEENDEWCIELIENH